MKTLDDMNTRIDGFELMASRFCSANILKPEIESLKETVNKHSASLRKLAKEQESHAATLNHHDDKITDLWFAFDRFRPSADTSEASFHSAHEDKSTSEAHVDHKFEPDASQFSLPQPVSCLPQLQLALSGYSVTDQHQISSEGSVADEYLDESGWEELTLPEIVNESFEDVHESLSRSGLKVQADGSLRCGLRLSRVRPSDATRRSRGSH